MSYIKDALDELERPEYREDTERIVKVAFEHGVILTLTQAERAWLLFSESMAAGWMGLPDSDEKLWEIINS